MDANNAQLIHNKPVTKSASGVAPAQGSSLSPSRAPGEGFDGSWAQCEPRSPPHHPGRVWGQQRPCPCAPDQGEGLGTAETGVLCETGQGISSCPASSSSSLTQQSSTSCAPKPCQGRSWAEPHPSCLIPFVPRVTVSRAGTRTRQL